MTRLCWRDSRRKAFTACLRFAAREFIFASRPLRFTTYHFVPLFACLCVAGAGGACRTTRSRARAARAAGARGVVGVRGGTFRLRFLVVGSSNLFVCCWLCLCVPVGTTPSSSCASIFVSLSLRRSRLGSRAVGNRQRMAIDEIGSIALLFRLVLSLTAFSSRHPAER